VVDEKNLQETWFIYKKKLLEQDYKSLMVTVYTIIWKT